MGKNKAVIRAADATNLQSWKLPAVKGAIVNSNQKEPAVENHSKKGSDDKDARISVEQLEKIRKKAHEEGFEQGITEAKASFQQQTQPLIKHFEEIIEAIAKPLSLIDETIEEELLKIVLLIAKQVIRREIQQQPEQIIAVIRESLAVLPENNDLVKIRVHPDDASCIRQIYQEQFDSNNPNWQLTEDPLITLGGCLIDIKASHLDATIENRMNQIAQSLLASKGSADKARGGSRDAD